MHMHTYLVLHILAQFQGTLYDYLGNVGTDDISHSFCPTVLYESEQYRHHKHCSAIEFMTCSQKHGVDML